MGKSIAPVVVGFLLGASVAALAIAGAMKLGIVR